MQAELERMRAVVAEMTAEFPADPPPLSAAKSENTSRSVQLKLSKALR